MAAEAERQVVKDLQDPATEKPPVLGSWGAWYALVLVTLLFIIAGFAVLSRVYD